MTLHEATHGNAGLTGLRDSVPVVAGIAAKEMNWK